MRLGDLDALKAKIPELDSHDNGCYVWLKRFEVEELIDNAPTVPLPDFKEGYKQAIIDGKTNYSRPQGEWKLDNIGVYCTECGMHPDYSSNFCPNCGADMRGDKE